MSSVRQASLHYLNQQKRKAILIVSNCQTWGIVHSMQGASRDYKVVGLPISDKKLNDITNNTEFFAKFDHIFAIDQARTVHSSEALSSKTGLIPNIYFDGYHPDLMYLVHNGNLFDSPIGDYHSCLVYAAFVSGYTSDEAEQLFTRETFEGAGFFEQWTFAKARLFNQFKAAGFRAEEHFYHWVAAGAFMHTTNHPKIAVLADIGFEILARLGSKHERSTVPANDGLADLPIFPVYPEIAERTGAAGSYAFKPVRTNERLTLREFIDLSYAAYATVPHGSLAVATYNKPRLDRVLTLISGMKGRPQ